MKVFVLPPLLLLLAAFAAPAPARAQDTPAAALEVVKHSWSKERLNWERDPFSGVIENFDDARVRMRNESRVARTKGTPEGDRIDREARADQSIIAARHQSKPARYAFLYKASLRNTADRPTRTIDWDYVFTDAATGEEVGRHQFTSDEKIGPGKQGGVVVYIAAPPARTISVNSLNSKERDSLNGRVEVVRILYADGSVWERK
ncbi:MAG TPA: hypothetical protein VF240_18365 [Pyrinomonadaceae bacterium]